MPESSAESIQVISRAAHILRICRDEGPGLSLGGIARSSGLPRSTVQRIVAALVNERLLATSGRHRSICLGPESRTFATSSDSDVLNHARPHILALSQATGETVDLACLRGEQMEFIDQISGLHRLRAVSAVGEAFPLHCTANGKAALALLPIDEAMDLLPARLEGYTAKTQTTRTDLRAELKSIRHLGYAVDVEEHSPGICAIGAALRDPHGAIYAVSVPVPAVRFARIRRDFALAIQTTASRIQQSLTRKP